MYKDCYQRKMFEMLKDYGERLIHYSEDVLSGSSTNAASRKWNIYTSDVKKIAELAAVEYEEPELIELIKERRFMTWEERFVADLSNPHKAVEMRVAIGDAAYVEIYNYLSLNGLIR